MGGAIIKNKLFYFLSADITRRNFPMSDSQVKVGFVDTANQVWVGCGAPATAAQCSAINGLLPRFFGQIQRKADNDLYFGRVDYRSTAQPVSASSISYAGCRRTASRRVFPHNRSGNHGQRRDAVSVRNGKATWTSRLPASWVNVFRYGLDTDRQAEPTRLNIAAAAWGIWMWRWPAYSLGPAKLLPRVEPMETRHEFADDVSWTKGKHTIKGGVSFEHVMTTSISSAADLGLIPIRR